ncbi:MAG: hypothetical protein AAGF06_06855 [Pseudomonadota bacterium]
MKRITVLMMFILCGCSAKQSASGDGSHKSHDHGHQDALLEESHELKAAQAVQTSKRTIETLGDGELVVTINVNEYKQQDSRTLKKTDPVRTDTLIVSSLPDRELAHCKHELNLVMSKAKAKQVERQLMPVFMAALAKEPIEVIVDAEQCQVMRVANEATWANANMKHKVGRLFESEHAH